MSLVYRNVLRRVSLLSRLGCRKFSEEPDKSKPVKFSTSEAANWRAEFTRRGNDSYDDSPDAQPFIVSLSVGIFLLYFLYLREESDLDDRFNIFEDNLYSRVEGLEEVDLKVKMNRKLAVGESVTEIQNRLMEIEQEKKLKKSS